MRRFIALCTLAAAASVTAYAGDAAAAPLKCVSNDVNAGPAVVSDSVTVDAPIQKGHLRVPAAAAPSSTCAAPNAVPAVVEPAADFHYKAHMFKNRTNAASCVEIRYVFTGSAAGTGFHETTAYLGGFDSANPAANYLGDSGRNEGGPDVRVFSVTVPALADFTLVTTWAGPTEAGYEPKYDLYVANCGQMVITGVTPNAGPVEGGQAVTITGSGFEGIAPASVAVGSPATLVGIVDDSTMNVTTSAHAAGVVDVSVTSAGGGSATLAAGYTYGAVVATDAGVDASTDGGVDAGRDASTGGPTSGGPTSGSSSSGGTTNSDSGVSGDAGDDDDSDASTGDGGAKKVSGTTKKKTPTEEEYVCACNEVGKSSTPGFGAFATMALGLLAVLRLRKRR